MKLKHRLLLGFAGPVTFVILVFFFLFARLDSLVNESNLRTASNASVLKSISDQQSLLELVYKQYLLSIIERRVTGDLKSAIQSYHSNWGEIAPKKDANFRHAGILDTCTTLWNTLKTNLTKQNKNLENKSTFAKLRSALAHALNDFAEQSTKDAANLNEQISVFRNYLIIAAVVALTFVILIFFRMRKFVLIPLSNLQHATRQMALQNYTIDLPVTGRDEIGNLSATINEMAARLKNSDSYKTSVLSQFTHEMKSPLGAVKQAVNLLADSLERDINKDQKQLLEIIEANNKRLFELIDRILLSARTEGADLQLTPTDQNIVKLFTQSLLLHSPLIKQKNIDVKLNFSAEQIMARVDKEKIEQVFANIISNAAKFSPTDSEIIVKIFEKSGLVIVRVSDRGIGIPQKELAFVFDKMYRASNAQRIAVKGTGLGLYVSGQIIRAHHGDIRVESVEAKGTTFEIVLPKKLSATS